MKEKQYKKEDLVIHWKPDLCEHAAKCVQGAPDVFEVGRKPWIKPELASKELITNVIDQCPSGALTYEIKE